MSSKKKPSISSSSLRAVQGLLDSHYSTLRELARRILAQRRLMQKAAGPDRVSPSSLVAEATLRLLLQRTEIRNAEHLHGLAALSMQRSLTDRARQRGATRRVKPKDAVRERRLQDPVEAQGDLLHELEALRAVRPRQAAIVELVGLQGKPLAEAAAQLRVSVPTVERDLRAARAWLKTRLG